MTSIDATGGSPPPPRVILLGASNLTMALPLVIALALERYGGPLDVFAALGHGRSYGTRSTVFIRSLPGIEPCDLWEAIDPAPRADDAGARPCALLTDIGNDVAYGADPESIAAWIDTAIERLARLGARVVITRLPLASLESLGRTRFLVARSLLFPGHRITLAQALDRARRTDALVADIAATRGATLIEQRAEWYGFDPVHIRRRRKREVWGMIVDRLVNAEKPRSRKAETRKAGRLPLSDRLALHAAAPRQRWILGIEQRRAQPAVRLADGTRVSLY